MSSSVSIIIPTYNSLRWLSQAIDSALAQSLRDCEVIIVDDGSTDGTEGRISDRYGHDIRLFRKENGGLASARNLGLAQATGDYIQFLDADDYIHKDKAERHAAFLDNHPDVDVVYCHSLSFRDESPSLLADWWTKPYYRSGDIFQDILDQPFILAHATLSRAAVIRHSNGFDESLANLVDGEFWIRLASQGAIFQFLDGDPLAYYRIRSGSQSSDGIAQRRAMYEVARKFERKESRRGGRRRKHIARSVGKWQSAYAMALLEDGQLKPGWTALFLSLLKDRRNAGRRVARLIFVPIVGWRRSQRILHSFRR